MRHRWLHAVPVVTVLVVTACGGGSESAAPGAPTSDLDGAALYGANCASCHGADLGGTDQGPSHLSIVYEPGHHSDAAFRAAITGGAAEHHWDFGPMPPVDGLSDDEVDAIIAYVRSEQERQGFE